MISSQLTNQEEIFMFKKAFKSIIYFLGLSSSTQLALAKAIESVDEQMKTNVTLLCPDYITCKPHFGIGNKDCVPNFMPLGLSQQEVSVPPPYEDSVYTFARATDYPNYDQQITCMFQYRKSATEVRDAFMRKNPGASFHADTTKPNLWKKIDENLNRCDSNVSQNCPMY